MTAALLEKKSMQKHPGLASFPSSKSNKSLLPASYVPSPDTIIFCGRGKAASTAPGNRRLKMIVTQSLTQYSETRNRLVKSAIVSRVVSIVKQAADPEIAFVQFEQGHWWQVEDGVAHEKVGRLFRDCLPTQYRSSTKFKLARRRGRNAVKDDWNCSSHRSRSSVAIVPREPTFPTSIIVRDQSPSKGFMHRYADLQANYIQRRVASANKFHTEIIGDSANLVGEDKVHSAFELLCDVVGCDLEDCDTMGLEDSITSDLPDDISGIFSDDEE
jgi:hypothetical protein